MLFEAWQKISALSLKCMNAEACLQGKVVDGQPMCAYHGWRYNAKGMCTEMPSTVMSHGISVRHLACVEAGGMVWVAESGDAALQTLPQYPAVDSQRFRLVCRLEVRPILLGSQEKDFLNLSMLVDPLYHLS